MNQPLADAFPPFRATWGVRNLDNIELLRRVLFDMSWGVPATVYVDNGKSTGSRDTSRTRCGRPLNAIARQLNERPRKTLLYKTPAEKLAECVATIG